jgi:hypothetical protein
MPGAYSRIHTSFLLLPGMSSFLDLRTDPWYCQAFSRVNITGTPSNQTPLQQTQIAGAALAEDFLKTHYAGTAPGGDGIFSKRQVSMQKGLSRANASLAKTAITTKYLYLRRTTSYIAC